MKNPWLLLAWTGAFFAVLWLLDFPRPMVDDLAYCGAACNLAQGGDYSNPWLLRYRLPGHLFLVYPPLHSFALAGWLKLFGISARAMTAFPVAMYFVTAASTMALLWRQAPALLLWLAPLAVSTALLPLGLRTEPFAIALTMAGFALFERAPGRAGWRFFAFLLLFLGASVAPRLTLFSAALILFALNRLRRERATAAATGPWLTEESAGWTTPTTESRIATSDASPSPREARVGRGPGRGAGSCRLSRGLLGTWAPPAAALLASGAVFLVLIGFRLGEFIHAFLFHSQHVSERKINLLVTFLNDNPYLTQAQFLLVLLTAALGVFAWPPQKCEFTRLSLFVAAAFPPVALIGGLGAGSLWYINLILLLIAAAILNQRPELGMKLKATLCLALFVANAQVPAVAYGWWRGKIDTDLGPAQTEARATRPSPQHAVLVDEAVARYLFGYQLPPDFLDIHFAAPFPKNFAVDDLRPGDLYLIGPETVQKLKEFTLVDAPVPLWGPFGLIGTRRFPRHPRQVYVVPVEACHGLRAPSQSERTDPGPPKS